MPKDRVFHMYKHLCDVHNHTALASLKWRTPLKAGQGETPDLSVFRFLFWEPVWFLKGSAQHPERQWVKGRFGGIAWTTGDAMTYICFPDKDQNVGKR